MQLGIWPSVVDWGVAYAYWLHNCGSKVRCTDSGADSLRCGTIASADQPLLPWLYSCASLSSAISSTRALLFTLMNVTLEKLRTHRINGYCSLHNYIFMLNSSISVTMLHFSFAVIHNIYLADTIFYCKIMLMLIVCIVMSDIVIE